MKVVARTFLVAIWLAAAGMTGVLGFIGYELSRSRTAPSHPMPIGPVRQNRNEWARWVITEQRSAHRVLIAHVETGFLNEAVAITHQIADPVKDRYAEILVYFHRPGRPDMLPPRRVQWTRAGGYVQTVYADP